MYLYYTICTLILSIILFCQMILHNFVHLADSCICKLYDKILTNRFEFIFFLKEVTIMPKRITPGEIKKVNRRQIYRYIYDNERVSQQDISYALHLSRPTVAANLAELEEDGLIFKDGQQDLDQIGRKAAAYSIDSEYRVAVGVELTSREVKIIGVDLYGRKIERVVHKLEFSKTESYFKTVCGQIKDFISAMKFKEEQILGIGFAMQGLVSEDGTTVLYGAILDCTGLTVSVFEKYLNYPCLFVHDPDGAALSEIWHSPELKSAIYLSMSSHLGGSIISERMVRPGKHGHSATFEHITVAPGGEQCYCGKRGCAETILSMKSLLKGEEPDDFFNLVRTGDEEHQQRWMKYLGWLAIMIGNLHLVVDVDFILGGHLAPYFNETDIHYLYDEVRKLTPFYDTDDYIRISKLPSHNITIGAALQFIVRYLEDIDA